MGLSGGLLGVEGGEIQGGEKNIKTTQIPGYTKHIYDISPPQLTYAQLDFDNSRIDYQSPAAARVMPAIVIAASGGGWSAPAAGSSAAPGWSWYGHRRG